MIKSTPETKIKQIVLEKYDSIGRASLQQSENTDCCGVSGCSTIDYEVFSDDYTALQGYNKEADLGLGCGLPTEFAHIKARDTVVDLGSGAGNDCFVARQLTGDTGRAFQYFRCGYIG